MSEEVNPDRQAIASLGMVKAWERSFRLQKEVEAKGPVKEVYSIHCHVGSIYMLEDAEGIFWLDLDGQFVRADEGYSTHSTPKDIEFMRSKGVPEETIQRIVKQCECGDAERIKR